jgi:membrane peptidoglycan carboxypeptidase
MLWGLLVAGLLAAGLLTVAYLHTSVPSPNEQATAQTTVILAADNKTVIAKLGVNRTDVPLSAVPLGLQHAVLAAEDRHFYDEPAVSVTGTLRALGTDVVGGDITQGGSTITQQYVKNAYLSQQRTFTRKLSEILLAIKVGHETSKNQILDDYLNTIYFGRGAYGVSAAARAYFGKPLGQLDTAQDVVLAGVVNSPSVYDPRVDPAQAAARFRYVVGGMVAEGWLSRQQAAGLSLPPTKRPRSDSGCQGNDCFIAAAANAELASMGFSQGQLAQGGYRVVTTIDPKVQDAAQQSIREAESAGEINEKTGRPETSLVSIKPGNGAIEAMYSGPGCHHTKSTTGCVDTTGVTHLFDPSAIGYGRPAGSSMKPYTLVAALQQGTSLDQTFPGPAEIDVAGSTIHNAGDEVCSSPCTLQTALAESINTVFVPLAQSVGPATVARVAHKAGIPADVKLGEHGVVTPEVTLGVNDVPVVGQADGYATIAAGGQHAAPYLVSQVLDAQGQVVAKAHPKLDRAFSSDVAANAIQAMRQVLECTPVQGTACGKALADGRPAAGKTGTATNASNANSDAWFIGFTPQLSTAVWVGNDKHGSTLSAGGLEIYGGQVPAGIWQSTMDTALAGLPVQQFPTPTQTAPVTPPPTVSTVPTTSTSLSPTGTPTTTAPSSSPTTTSPTATPTATVPSTTLQPSSAPPTGSPKPSGSSHAGGGAAGSSPSRSP